MGDYPTYEARVRFLLGQIKESGEKVEETDKGCYLVSGINSTDPLCSAVRQQAETKSKFDDALKLLRAWSETLANDASRSTPLIAAAAASRGSPSSCSW